MFRNARDLAKAASVRQHIWIQFCEGIVEAVEAADDYVVRDHAFLARIIIASSQDEDYFACSVRGGELSRQILRLSPSLHRSLLYSMRHLTPMPNIDIRSRATLGTLGGPSEVRLTNRNRIEDWPARLDARSGCIQPAIVPSSPDASRSGRRISLSLQRTRCIHA